MREQRPSSDDLWRRFASCQSTTTHGCGVSTTAMSEITIASETKFGRASEKWSIVAHLTNRDVAERVEPVTKYTCSPKESPGTFLIFFSPCAGIVSKCCSKASDCLNSARNLQTFSVVRDLISHLIPSSLYDTRIGHLYSSIRVSPHCTQLIPRVLSAEIKSSISLYSPTWSKRQSFTTFWASSPTLQRAN